MPARIFLSRSQEAILCRIPQATETFRLDIFYHSFGLSQPASCGGRSQWYNVGKTFIQADAEDISLVRIKGNSMKKTALALALGLIASCAMAATRIVVFKNGTTAQQRKSQVEALGGKLVADYEYINESLADFGDMPTRSLSLDMARSAPDATVIDENRTRDWLQGGVYPPLAPVSGIISQARMASDSEPPAPVAEAAFSGVMADAKYRLPWGVERVNAKGAWKKGLDGSGVKVAVLDTGIDFNHPDLAPNIAGNYNALNHDAAARDDHGHGTHVAGTVAGVGDNDVFGVAPKAKIYAVKVLNARGSGNTAGIVDGINWTIGQHVNVINMSLGDKVGGEDDVPAFRQAVKAAHDAGIAVVCAAGNDYGAAVNIPAAYPDAIAVSASSYSNDLARFSNKGPQIKFIAPGSGIHSAKAGGGYTFMDGTSMSSPHVAGLAALAYQAGAAGPDQAMEMLRAAALKLHSLKDNEQGFGLVNAEKIGK